MNLTQVTQWREDALADRWTIEPLYHFSDGKIAKPQSTAAKMTKGDFIAQVYARKENDCHVSIWRKSDGLSVDTPEVYSMAKIEKNSHLCQYCGKSFEKTVSIGFAGRCCPACRVTHLAEVEYPGWCD
jgi:tRNA(Ile2) C34 agmatinyltransferase TiaS